MSNKLELDALFKSESYASSFKRWEMVTRPFADMLVDQSKVVTDSKANPDKPLVVLDNACGTGVISSSLIDKLDDTVKKTWKLTCGDISPAMVESTTRRIQEDSWQNAEAKIVDAQKPELASAQFSHIFSAFVYMVLPESDKALDETVRMLQPGGTVAFSTWIEPGWVAVSREAIKRIPGSLPFPEAQELMAVMAKGQWYSKSWIESQLEERGLQDIDVRPTTIKLTLTRPVFFEMAMLVLPTMMKPFWTEQQWEENKDKVGPALEKYLEDTYGNESIQTDWVAILSTARKSC
ncbi:hypothetical protein PITC_096960 [Penicillium italicum]|uniref:Methyltransferase domain-containing protein n=1 Tax=Penicillium italicum TaxID=40296 RepID=A0A0A2L156_PENIT|nr:hypothetical protein PITC_096960 [Penicillium italicum]